MTVKLAPETLPPKLPTVAARVRRQRRIVGAPAGAQRRRRPSSGERHTQSIEIDGHAPLLIGNVHERTTDGVTPIASAIAL